MARLWWLPVLVGLGVGSLFGPEGMGYSALLLMAACAFVAGTVVVPWVHATWAAPRGDASRYFCTSCLEFSRVQLSCRACGVQIPPPIAHTGGAYLDACPVCAAPLFESAASGAAPQPIRAECCACKTELDPEVCGRRRVRVVGVLLTADFEALQERRGAPVATARRLRYFWSHGDSANTCMINLGDLHRKVKAPPFIHVPTCLDALWLEGSSVTVLELAEAVDRYLTQAGVPEKAGKRIPVGVRQHTVEPSLQRLLAGRFRTVRYGVEPEDPANPVRPEGGNGRGIETAAAGTGA